MLELGKLPYLLTFAAVLMLARPMLAQTVRVVDEAVKVGSDGRIFSSAPLQQNGYFEKNPAWDGKKIILAGAKGEGLAFQVLVEAAGGSPLPKVHVSVSELRSGAGSIAPDAVTVYRQWYIEVTRPSTSPHGHSGLGWYPDALVPADAPRHGLPVDVPAGKTQGLWVDLRIPRQAAAGAYTATVTVTADGEALAALPLTLEVYPFALPVRRHLRWRIGYTGFDQVAAHWKIPPGSDEWLAIERQLYRMCWEDARVVPTTHYNSPRPPFTGTGADLRIDWTDYDRRFGPYLDGSAFADRQPVNIYSLPINVDHGYPTGGRTADLAKLDVPMLESAVKQMAAHWDAKGWRLEDGFVYVADEPAPDRYPFIQKACQTLRAASGNRIATSVAFYTHFAQDAPALVKAFAGSVTMWDIAGDCFDYPAVADRRKAGETLGFYQGSEPFQGSEALDGDGLSLTTWPWIAYRYGLDHLFLYNMTEWSYFRLDRCDKPWKDGKREIWENPLNQSWQTNSQGVLVYPGQYVGLRGIVPSIRLKQARRGMQDYEYLWMLADAGGAAAASEICRSVMPRALHEAAEKDDGKFKFTYGPGHWPRDPRAWDAARRDLARRLAAATTKPSAPETP